MHSRGLDLQKFVTPEIIFSLGALHLAGQYGRNLGGSKALVVSDPGVLAAGWVQQVLASVGGGWSRIHAVYAGHPQSAHRRGGRWGSRVCRTRL